MIFLAGNPEAVCAWNLEGVGRPNRDRISWTTDQSPRAHSPHVDRINDSGTNRLVSERAVDEWQNVCLQPYK